MMMMMMAAAVVMVIDERETQEEGQVHNNKHGSNRIIYAQKTTNQHYNCDSLEQWAAATAAATNKKRFNFNNSIACQLN